MSAASLLKPEQQALADGQRLLFLDGLRALAALWVLFGHIYLFAIGWQAQSSWLARPFNLLMYLHLGVDIFLVLSGYCLALPVVAHGGRIAAGLPAFFTARALRILPPYFATLGLILLVNCFVPLAAWGRNDLGLTPDISAAVWWTNLLLLQDVYGQYNNINAPFWSIACEWHLYFVFPLLVLALRRAGVAWLLALGVLAAIVLTTLSSLYPRLPLIDAAVPQPPYFIILFVFGIAAAQLSHGQRFAAVRSRIHQGAWWCAGLLLVLLAGVVAHYRIVDVASAIAFGQKHVLIDPLAAAFTAALLVALSGQQPGRGLRRVFEQRWLVRAGGFSYSLYLIHIPIAATVHNFAWQQPWAAQLSALQMFMGQAVVSGALCIGAAAVFARVFERRIRWRPARRASTG